MTGFLAFSQTGLQSERLWKSPNGKSLRGVFSRLLENRTKVEILGVDGRVHLIAIENLAAEDQALVLGINPEPVGNADAFQPEKFPERQFADAELVKKLQLASSYEAAICLTMLWWDQTGSLKIPLARNREKNAEWLGRQLEKKNPDPSELGGSLRLYFERHLTDTATLRVFTLPLDQLDRATVGMNGILISLRAENRGNFYAAVETADKDGAFAMYCFGKRFTGKIAPADAKSEARFGDKSPRVIIDNWQDMPKSISEAQSDPSTLTSSFFMVFKPYLFAQEGKPAPPPAEPLMLH